MEGEDDDLEFEVLVKEFTVDTYASEYANFEQNVPASEPICLNWWIWSKLTTAGQRRQHYCNSESWSDQVEEIFDDVGNNDENDELEQESMGFKEIITMLDKMKQCPVFDDDSQDMLSTIT